MLTFTINGESHQVTADQFRTLVDVAVRIMTDASRDAGVEFTLEALHASAPTIVWGPQAKRADIDVDQAFHQVADRISSGLTLLEEDDGVPEWMTPGTANILYQAAAWFGDTAIDGVSFRAHGMTRRLTRQTYRTLDRILHEDNEALGSVIGTLMTATLHNGAHVTVREETYGRGVECYLGRTHLREAGQLIGERVTVVGRIKRDHLGRPLRISDAHVEPAAELQRVSVAEMGGAFQGGPNSVEWLRAQRSD